jgi:hypothetical protein
MREPLVRDRITHAKDRGNEEEKEARMIALLCNLSEQDLWLMTAADYSQLLDAFNVFMLPPAKRPKAAPPGNKISGAAPAFSR